MKEEQARMVQQLHVLGYELTSIKRDRDEKEIHLKDQEMERELMLGAVSWKLSAPSPHKKTKNKKKTVFTIQSLC